MILRPSLLATTLLLLIGGRPQELVANPEVAQAVGDSQTERDTEPRADNQKAGIAAIEQARAALRAAETAHPGNSVEICDALESLVGLLLDARMVDEGTMELVKREVAVAEAGPGPSSKPYEAAIGELAEVLVAMDRPAEARPWAEKALEIATAAFPNTIDFVESADTLGFVCEALGDYVCALRAQRIALDAVRRIKSPDPFQIVGSLSNMADTLNRMGNMAGAIATLEEALALAYKEAPNDPHMAIVENNLGADYSQDGQLEKAIPHLMRSIELSQKRYGDDAPLTVKAEANLAALYGRNGQLVLSWKYYEKVLAHSSQTGNDVAYTHANYGRALAAGGRLEPAMQQGLVAEKLGRESFVLSARSLPERQALAFDKTRATGLDLVLSILTRHPELVSKDVFQEVIRSRALVADEMARRQKNLNRSNDPEIARLLKELDRARSALLTLEQADTKEAVSADAIAKATETMERAEAAVALKSASFRSEERVEAVALDDVRRSSPMGSLLISYMRFKRTNLEKIDLKTEKTPSYGAFVLHPDTGRLRFFDLGDAKEIDALIEAARKTVEVEMRSGGMGGRRNERAFREAAGALRQKIWDPLRTEFGDAKLLFVTPDGELNLVPFAAFPDGDGYWLDHGSVIHVLSSERDLIPEEDDGKKSGLLAMGDPAFNEKSTAGAPDIAGTATPATRSATLSCEELKRVEFQPLPQSALEVRDIAAQWRAANSTGSAAQLLGADATREGFLREAVRGRVLHVATHAFLLSQSCGDGNPLLHSGLVFAGANNRRESSLLTAQEIASLDLSGLDWAVLSACNTGVGELHDGEGVLGLQRAVRVAGAHSVIMTLWPVDDGVSRRYMHELYHERFGQGATTADAIWNASRKLLADRRAAGLSTHPWYWAGFVGAGRWQ